MLDLGLNYQAVGTALALRAYDGVESSWNGERKAYDAELRFRPWYNGRETGVVVQMFPHYVSNKTQRCVNYAIFEHRNSDHLCVWRWETDFPRDNVTWQDIPEGIAPDKWTHQFSVGYGEGVKLADMLIKDMNTTWRGWEEREG